MKREIIVTGDGSKTIFIEDLNEHYHSKHGAINEALHVFIKNGLQLFQAREISILEVGFGTGLNALVTLFNAKQLQLKVTYVGVEAYPVSKTEINQLNYPDQLEQAGAKETFNKLHETEWEIKHEINADFTLTKRKQLFKDIKDVAAFDLIYFDAFGPRVQPDLWTEAIFVKMYTALKAHGVLVTYSAKGSVRRAMQASGFQVEKLPGPPGKREMLRALKRVDK
ncbi:tRNA (5-methylaminomethyl-2-thiouridine)(34)-methyltransferase MnmD [Flavobacteriaceae bacterium M23B6Z8]